jgi:catechol 2,3-dioxygenase-like lactoylglutathione lyase family enzyme
VTSRRCWRPTAAGSRSSRWTPGDPPPADPLRHVAFRTSRRGLGAAKYELRDRGVEFEERDYGVAWSIYMPDPDGHLVEITTYEVTRG